MRGRMTFLVVFVFLVVLLGVAACTQAQPSPTVAPATATKAAAVPTQVPAATAAVTAAATKAATAAATTAPAATKAATVAGTTAAGGIPAISALHQPIAQRQDCLSCHKQDGFMPAPASHVGRTSQTCTGCHQATPAGTPPVTTLAAAKADRSPLDDAAQWGKAKVATVHVNGGLNQSETDVTLRSVYTTDTVFFQVQYKDPTESVRRRPWQKQADGTWRQLGRGERENQFYEDKFALLWNIGDTIKDFNTQGCAVVCHATTQGREQPLKYSNAPGELGDIWHGKLVRTLPVGQIDDQYLDDDQKAVEAGRKSDANTGGGYANNTKEGASTPPFALPNNRVAPPYWILDSEKTPFDDSKYKANDEVPGIVIAPFQGDRGEIAVKGGYRDGTWTMEFSRKLTTGSKTDVQFSDLAKQYHFGVAVFDNTQIGHAVQYGVTLFTFER
ncbi:MAG: ethylbenzene dehydrogenase-related protein [Chloroflexota bacterium]